MTRDACPVCRRAVSVSSRHAVIRHQDTIGQPCPMSNVSYPRNDFEVSAA